MEILLGLAELDRSRPRAVAIGVFDGLHRGHQALLRRLVREASASAAVATAVTFDPHPDAVLRGVVPPRLGDPEQMVDGLEAIGVGELVVQSFDESFARLEPEAFLRLLGAGAGLRAFVMTADTAFGHERRGDAATVASRGRRMGFRLVLVEPVRAGGAPISSKRIRAAIGAGRLAEASRLLGRQPSVTGRVVSGAGRGRDLGFPTANLAFDAPVTLPPDGIYAVHAAWRGGQLSWRRTHTPGTERAAGWSSGGGVASLGRRPTFGGGERVFEVHLFDIDEALYGATMRVELVRRLRAERRFATPAALVRQMERDAVHARQILAERRGRLSGAVC